MNTEAKPTTEEEKSFDCPMMGKPNASNPACQACENEFPTQFSDCYAKWTDAQSAKAAAKRTTGSTKVKGMRSPARLFVKDALVAGCFTREQIIRDYLIVFPENSPRTPATDLSDSMNPKYNPFAFVGLGEVLTDKVTKVMYFEQTTPAVPDYQTVARAASGELAKAVAEKKAAAEKIANEKKVAAKKKPAAKKKAKKK